MDNKLEYLLPEEESQIYQEVRAWRHHLHQYPELSMVETLTSEYIITKLKEFGFEEIYGGIAGTGVVAILRGRIDESLLLRADMDALPIEEKTPVEYISKHHNIMHACGHDAHVAMLLGAAKVMIGKVHGGLKLNKGIKFCFQPGEENASLGAFKIINDKSTHDIMDASPKVKHCVGFHITSQHPVGTIIYRAGPFNANSDKWEIVITGKGGHAIGPEFTIDALQIGVELCNQIYQIKGRSVNQCTASTISIGTFMSGESSNIITDTCTIVGTVRTVHAEDRQNIFKKFQLICDGAQLQHQCQIVYKKFPGNGQIQNDECLKSLMTTAINRVGTLAPSDMGLAGEDFSFFANLRPSAFVAIGAAIRGAGSMSQYLHHSSTFDIDEAGLLVGVKTWLSILQEWQK